MNDVQLQQCLRRIMPLEEAAMAAARERQAQLAKPPGSLGALEDISIQVAGITGKLENRLEKRRIIVLCADNGVVEEGVASAPQSVTLAQTINLTRGMTGASALAAHFGDEMTVVDVGVNARFHCPAVLDRKLAMGTRNLFREPAMERETALAAIAVGMEQAQKAAADGVSLLGVGEMGIGNTTTSAAVLAALTGAAVPAVVGRGGGITDAALDKKRLVVQTALEKHRPDPKDPVDVLSKVGGLDLCAMCGVFLGAAVQRIPVVVDGYISVVAALCAARLCPTAVQYMLPSHSSFEVGFQLAAKELGLHPFLDMGMRLGEGSGCPLAFSVIRAACAVLCDMATFAEANIDDGYLEEIRKEDCFTV